MNGVHLEYTVDGENFTSAGEASSSVKNVLKQLGLPGDVIRRVSIAMYEAEINMVIHAQGGTATVDITPEKICMVLQDKGPGIPDVEKAMQEGFSTAPDDVRNLGFGAGMGLPNIKKYSDDLQIDTKIGEGTKLTITIKV